MEVREDTNLGLGVVYNWIQLDTNVKPTDNLSFFNFKAYI